MSLSSFQRFKFAVLLLLLFSGLALTISINCDSRKWYVFKYLKRAVAFVRLLFWSPKFYEIISVTHLILKICKSAADIPLLNWFLFKDVLISIAWMLFPFLKIVNVLFIVVQCYTLRPNHSICDLRLKINTIVGRHKHSFEKWIIYAITRFISMLILFRLLLFTSFQWHRNFFLS